MDFEEAYWKLIDEQRPWAKIIRFDQIQRDSKMLPDAEPLTERSAVLRAVDIMVNQQRCYHPDDQQKVIDHVSMGSFTATVTECQRCGVRRSDD